MKRYADIVSGSFLVLVSIIFFFETKNMRALKIMQFGPRVMPRLLTITLFIVGIAIAVTGIMRLQRNSVVVRNKGEQVSLIDYKKVIATMVLITFYVFGLQRLGFVLVTIVYLFCQFLVLGGVAKRRLLIYGLLSFGIAFGIYYLFYFAFNVLLPPGQIW
jgi:putative tricarboxylic transport membrane protein